VRKTHTSRLFSALAAVVSVAVIAPATASASNSIDYVVVERDGSVDVRSLTPAQAATLAANTDIRAVTPERTISVSESPTEIVTGLTVEDESLQDGDVIPGRYIVQFTSSVATNVAANNVSTGIRAMFSHSINGFVADLSPDELEEISNNPNVVSVEPDRIVEVADTQTNPTWGLDRIDQRTLPFNSSYTYNTDGTGVSAYIIDTGVYSAHSEFTGRVVNGFTAINDGKGSDDCHGHGTHVAGTVAGTVYGVAKKATIIPVRVLSCSGSGSYSGVIAGIDWTVGHHQAGVPAVANMSLGGGASATVNAAVARAVADGITYVVYYTYCINVGYIYGVATRCWSCSSVFGFQPVSYASNRNEHLVKRCNTRNCDQPWHGHTEPSYLLSVVRTCTTWTSRSSNWPSRNTRQFNGCVDVDCAHLQRWSCNYRLCHRVLNE